MYEFLHGLHVCIQLAAWHMHYVTMPNTVESLNKGHVGANSFVPCGEVIPISEVKVLAWCHNKYPL